MDLTRLEQLLAFLSYQHEDRLVAAEVQSLLIEVGVTSFMAHEDIKISRKWQKEILKNLRKADVFVALLSSNYLKSAYCLQESGIAVYRSKTVKIIPLSLDQTVSPGCLAHVQAKRIDPTQIDQSVLYSGIVDRDPNQVLRPLIDKFSQATDYRSAETRFEELQPYLDRALNEHFAAILTAAANNGQIAHANLCARTYLPPLLRSHGNLMKPADRRSLRAILRAYES